MFNRQARDKMRAELGLLPANKVVLFSGAGQARKGSFIIPDVLKYLREYAPGDGWRFLFMGGVPPALEPSEDTVVLPRTMDETRVADYYAASDVYALPFFQDNLPNTISESLNCGTPVAAFPTGGIIEMVQTRFNGYLFLACTAMKLAKAIHQASKLANAKRSAIAEAAHAVYAPKEIARAHVDVFASAINAW